MADSDGKVRIIIDTNAKQATEELNKVGDAFQKNADTIKKSSSAYNSYEKAIKDNITVLRELALGGNQNTEGFKRLAAETKNYQQAIKEANDAVNKATGNFENQKSPVTALTSGLKGLFGAYLGLRGIQAITGYIMQSTEAFRTQERAVLSLNNTLANAGIYSVQYSQHLQTLASAIQQYSNYGDEAILKAVAIGQAFAGQTKITDQLIKATIDFAAANEMDLDSAFRLVGKSIGSNTNALARYGIELNKNMSDSEKAISLAIQLGNRYEGQAKQMSDASIQLKNAMGDLSETVGGLFNPAIEESEHLLTAFINKMNETIKLMHSMGQFTPKNLAYEFLPAPFKILSEFIPNTKPKPLKKSSTAKFTNKPPVKYNDDFVSGSSTGTTKATAQAKHIKDAYEKAQEAVNNARRAVQNAALTYGTSSQQVQTAFEQYKKANEKLQNVDDLFKVTETKTKFQELQQQIQETKDKLQELYLSGEGKGDAFKETKNKLVELETQLQNMNTAITSRVGLDWKTVTDSIKSNLTSALLTPLQQGESAFDRLASIGLNAVQLIGQEIIKNLLKQITLEKTLQAIKNVGRGIGGWFSGLFGNANGNVFNNGRVQPYANGGIVNQPTVFPMANGMGLMGEAGAEAIMPLTRRNGKLGVEGSPVTVNIINQSNSQIETRQRDNGSFDIIVKRVNEALMNERTAEGFSYAQNRASSKGVTAA